MANILTETVSVSAAGANALRIQHSQVHDDGIDMGGTLVLDQSAAGWLSTELDKAADAWGYAELNVTMGPDQFTIYIGGSDMQPFVHVHNQRDAAAVDGGVYTLAMTTDVARTLSQQLAAA